MRFEAIHQEDGSETLPPPVPRPAENAVHVADASPSGSDIAAAPPPTRRRRLIMNLDRAVKRSYRSFLCQAVSPLISVTSDHPNNHERRRRRRRQRRGPRYSKEIRTCKCRQLVCVAVKHDDIYFQRCLASLCSSIRALHDTQLASSFVHILVAPPAVYIC